MSRLAQHLDTICEGRPDQTLKILKQEIIARVEEISRLKTQSSADQSILKSELQQERSKSINTSAKLEQAELKLTHADTKIRNLERSLLQKTKELEKLKIDSRMGGCGDSEQSLSQLSKDLAMANLKAKRAEESTYQLQQDLEESRKMISEQAHLIKEIKTQLEEATEIHQEKLRKKDSEIKVLQRDIDFTRQKYEEENRKNARGLKNKDIEIERLQDKVHMLEVSITYWYIYVYLCSV